MIQQLANDYNSTFHIPGVANMEADRITTDVRHRSVHGVESRKRTDFS